MTWKQLKDYIELQSQKNNLFLDKEICVYNYEDGEEHSVNIIELLEEKENEQDSGWVSYLTINEEIEDGQTEKTSISGLS